MTTFTVPANLAFDSYASLSSAIADWLDRSDLAGVAPQLVRLVLTSTQKPPQLVVLAGQPQLPLVQTEPPLQGSVSEQMARHAPLNPRSPAAHWSAAFDAPVLSTRPGATKHAPMHATATAPTTPRSFALILASRSQQECHANCLAHPGRTSLCFRARS